VAKSLFKNADIVIDRFHIVVQIYVALNTARVNLCKKSNPNYNKLKKYWKLILKDENELTDQKKYSYHFKKDVSQRDIVTYLINTDQHLKANYECYQGLLNTIKTKDLITFKAIVTNQNKDLHIKMTKALKLFRENMKYIENSFKYEINNGMIEGTNKLIKTIKRIACGYRKYNIFKARIMLIKGIVKG
jgi:transposase